MLQKNFKIVSLCIALLAVAASSARADDSVSIQQLHDQVQQMQQQIDVLSKRPAEQSDKQEKVSAKVTKREEQSANLGKAVQLYGQLRLSVDNYSDDFGAGTGGAGGDGITVKSNASRFGIKGEIPTGLGNTSMIYQAEVLYGAADNPTNEIEWREGYAGLKGDWGQVRLGRLDVLYKTTLTTIDPWNDTAAQSRGFGGRQGSSSLHANYFTNTGEYVSPSFKGFKAGAWLSNQLDDETSSIHGASPITNFKGGDAKGIGVKFNKGGLFVGADWIEFNADNVASGVTNGSGWQLAGRYEMGDWSLGAMYEDVKDLGLGSNLYLVGTYTYKPGKTTLIATLGRNRDATTYSNRNIDTWSLGAKYALTKDSELFTTWVDRSEDAFGTTRAKDYQILTLGINAKFGY